jgi:hypothetical protein
MAGDKLKLGYDDVLSFTIGSRRVEARCRMPHGGDKAIWGIRVDGSWYGMDREGQHDDTEAAIRKAAEEWITHRLPGLVE